MDMMNAHLSEREIDILTLIGEGLSDKEVAFELDISPRTVHSHMNRIMMKLGARNRTNAINLFYSRRDLMK